ncbi:MAG: hypothetical protein H6Q15_1493 [Bacteroidetes bacterium]|nr:hypothetical protein [Bacteroidota bacterium]
MKKITIILLLTPFFLFSQKSDLKKYLSFDSTLFVNEEVIKTKLNIAYTSDSNNIYFVDKNNTNRIGTLDISTKKIIFTPLNLSGKEKYVSRPSSSIVSIDYFNNKVFLFYYEYVLICQKKNGVYDFIEKIDIPFDSPINSANVISENKILFFINYLGLGIDYDKSTSFIIFDYKTKEIIEKNIEFNSPLYTYYGINMLSIDSDRIYVSQANEFNIRVYNKNLEPIDSLVFKKSNWEKIPNKKMEKIFQKSPQPINRMSYFNSIFMKYPSIIKIYAVNDFILVSYLKPESEGLSVKLDLFKKNNGEYKLLVEDNSGGIDEIERFSGYLAFHSDCMFVGDKIIQFRKGTTVDKSKFKSESEYEQAVNEYYKNNDGILIIDIFNSSIK